MTTSQLPPLIENLLAQSGAREGRHADKANTYLKLATVLEAHGIACNACARQILRYQTNSRLDEDEEGRVMAIYLAETHFDLQGNKGWEDIHKSYKDDMYLEGAAPLQHLGEMFAYVTHRADRWETDDLFDRMMHLMPGRSSTPRVM